MPASPGAAAAGRSSSSRISTSFRQTRMRGAYRPLAGYGNTATSTDEARAAELVDAALTTLTSLLRPGGRFLMKVFMDTGYPSTLARLRATFADVRTTRPTATRHGSAELYAVGLGHRVNP